MALVYAGVFNLKKMKYNIKKEIIKRYHYRCVECGNEFYNLKYIDPYKCHDCGASYPFSREYEEKIEEIEQQYCPICNVFFETSDYIKEHIEDEHVRWLANMVTHYRHCHITTWNKVWGKNGYGSHNLDESTYDKEKAKVNERAKRQILRKCKDYMVKDGFKVEHIKQLQNTEKKTIELYEKLLK